METSELAKLSANRISWAASQRGLSINRLLAAAGVSKSVVDRMRLGTMPSADKLSAIAEVLRVPVSFLLSSGRYEKWDLLLDHRGAVLSSISSMLKDVSDDILSGVDDLTYAQLVSAFDVDLEMGENPAGLEIVVSSPIATGQQARVDAQKAPDHGISRDRRELLSFFDGLSDGDRRLLISEARLLYKKVEQEKDRSSNLA